MVLSGAEFLRRFVEHVLPKGFVKVRHYGLLAARDRDARLTVCRRLLAVEGVRTRTTSAVPADAAAPVGAVAPVVEPCGPYCGGRRLVRRDLPRQAAPAALAALAAPTPDTS